MNQAVISRAHVLLIDDEKFMRSLVERTLRDMGVTHITQAENGAEGLKFVKRFKDDIDVIICDVQMPEMNGLEFVQNVRNGGEDIENPQVPILMLTGHADEEIVTHAIKLGINGYLVKPISRAALEPRLIAAIEKKVGT